MTAVECKVNKGVIGKLFKSDGKMLIEYLSRLDYDEVDALDKVLQANG